MILCPPMRAGGNGGSRFVDPARGACFAASPSLARRLSGAVAVGQPGTYSKQIRNSGMQSGNSAEREVHMFPSGMRFFLITAGCVFMAAAQDQPQAYVVDTCVKAVPGKGEEIGAYIREVLVKTAQVRVDQGTAAWYLALSAVVPAGSEARCDYHLATGYKGFPPEASAERAAADRKKAGITMTPAENAARAR